ncbi:MAG: TIGR01212 family radical SAM protein [Erysipelotrichaceae bacterium]|nr:TIGR01212 family radical SAM protein [Erysipelotrichaceae bacterium]MBQ6492721.1 TIGR01212 family radical SAM protein [Erysipelotrichaceae bacterium]
MNNPFPFSFNEKRYHTFNYYLKTRYHQKVAKVILDGGFTCPNRDGSKGSGGCIFCSEKGSGDSNLAAKEDVMTQYLRNREVMIRKWPDTLFIPYFQSFTNTYGPLEKIRSLVDPFVRLDEAVEIAISTRCDCLEDETIAYLDSVAAQKPLWLELGLQTSNDRVGEILNRQYSFSDLVSALEKLKDTHIKVCIHVMNGLPFETKEDMLKTVKDIAHLPFDGIKIHMLHIIRNTTLAKMNEIEAYELISRDDYIDLVVRQLEELRPEVIVQRLTGDPIREDLIAPQWLLKKVTILNDIDKRMRELDTWQGKNYEQ